MDDVGIHESHGKWWAALPSRPMLDNDKKVVIDDRHLELYKREKVILGNVNHGRG